MEDKKDKAKKTDKEPKQTSKQEFSSDNVSFTLERKPECVVEYQVKVHVDLVKKAYHNALRSISKEVSLPGFRKGRAPDHLLAKKFPDAIDERWQKTIADEAFKACQELAKIPLLSNDSRISFNVTKHSLDSGAEMSFSFESEPEVPEIDLSKLELEEVKKDLVDTKKVDATIHDIQMFFAEWETITDRAVQEGDYTVIDVDIIEETPNTKALSDARFEVSKEKMAGWMHKLVIGMKAGDSKEGISEPDPDAPEDQKTPAKKVKLTVNKIEAPKTPEVDDTLAQKVGADNAKDLREKVEHLLNKQADEQQHNAYREQVNHYLVNHVPVSLPKTLVQKETQFRLKQLVSDPHFQKKVMQMDAEERKKAIQDIETQGERAVRLFYISRKIIQDQNIPVSPAETQQQSKTPLEAMFSPQSDLYSAHEQSQEQQAIAMSRLILSKAEEFVISKAPVVPAKPKPKKAVTKTNEATSEPTKKTATKKKVAAKKTPAKKTSSAKKTPPKKKT